MKLGKLKLRNFGPYKEAEIDLSRLSVAGIVCTYKDNPRRSNGGGKSKILEAVAYCLYGIGRDQFEEELIRENEEVMYAYLSFDKDGKKIEIERTKSESKTMLVLKINGADKSESKPETEAKIVKLLGMDYDLFIATVFFEQDKSDNFTSANPADRKEYLKKLLKLEIWDDCYARAKDQMDMVEKDLSAAKSQLEYVIGKEEEDLDDIKKEYSLLKIENERIEQDIKSVKEKSKDQVEAKSTLDSLDEKISNAQETRDKNKETYDENLEAVKKYDRKIAEIKKAKEENKGEENKESLQKRETEIEKEKESLQSDKVNYNTQINSLSRNSVTIEKSDDCPVCERSLSKPLKEDLLAKHSKAIASLSEKVKKIGEKQIKLDDEYDIIQEKLEKINENNKVGEIDIGKYEAKIESIKESNEKIRQEILKSDVELSKLQKQRSAAKKEYDANFKSDFEVELEELENENKESISKLSKLKERMESLKDKQKELEELREKVKKLTNRYNNWNILKNAFSKNGIISEIIKNSIEELEENANQVLSEIDDGEFKISFETEGETKKGKPKDTLDIWINNVKRKTQRKYRSYSGGQRAIFNFSIRMALSMLLSKREGVFYGIVFLDEIFGSLDEYNREKMKKVINFLKGMFPQIFAISHTDLQEAFHNLIKIEYEKKTNTSKIVEVS